MNAARLQQIEEIYHRAADSGPVEREAFVRQQCGDDENLRREVESLLVYDQISESFIDSSPDAIAAEMFSDEDIRPTLIGRDIGHYKIRRLLGVGGMGEVYLAEDSLLNRNVALKILPPDIVEHGDRLKRFKQEARASSALNHPNILTIHGFGTENGSSYIVTEFVDGVTLRQKMSEGGLSISETLDTTVQIASALAAAHEAGIVHRDIKPENIMIRRDGIVKVLDFGLAKLTMPTGTESESGTEAKTLYKTEPGLVMGTVAYMSPEQARGVKVDRRTDIWSLGVIVFEMLTAHLPFTGPTQTDVMVAILNKPIPMLEDFMQGAPAELDRIIDKALAKNTDDRYQGIEDMVADLRSLKSRLEFEAELERSRDPRSGKDKAGVGRKENTTRIIPAATTKNAIAPASRDRLSNNRLTMAVAGIALVIFGAVGLYVWQTRTSNSSAQPPVTAAPPAVPNNGETSASRMLTYSLTVQRYAEGHYKDPFTLSGEMLFGNRDRVRLNIKSPQTGYLYILNQGPASVSGEKAYNILFPSPTTNNGASLLNVGQEIQIPQQSWFELDAKEGTELVWLVWSENAVPDLESAKHFANPQDKGRIKDTELNKTIDSLLQNSQSNKPTVNRDDDKKESHITGNTGIVTHTIKLEHH
jgi:serine/threonine protein kinase